MYAPAGKQYNLRRRAASASQGAAAVDVKKYAHAGSDVESDETPGLTLEADTSRRLYSDVAASRAPSLTREEKEELIPAELRKPGEWEVSSVAGPITSEPAPVPDVAGAVECNDHSMNTSSSDEEPECEAPWTPVVRKKRGRKLARAQRKTTMPVTDQAIEAAEKALTADQRALIAKRAKKATGRRRREESGSRGEGPSRLKGKAVDPREWGAVDLENEEVDVEAQRAMLENFNALKGTLRDTGKSKKDTHRRARETKVPRSRAAPKGSLPPHAVRSSQTPRQSEARDVRPAQVINPKSYVGVTLNQVGLVTPRRRSKVRGNSPPTDSSDESSESSSDDSSSESSSDETSSSSPDPSSSSSDSDSSPSRRRSRRRSRSKRTKRRSTKRSRSRLGVKSFKPKVYNGAPDARAYNRFVKESEMYLVDNKIKSKRRAFILSYFLEGRAYDFYIQKVSRNEAKWTLERFYSELYNFCFPINFTIQLHKKLQKLYQNDKSVSEYAHELEELFVMIGTISKRERVIKFWNGARASIQQGLWLHRLNPDTATWREVVDQAEIIETAERAVGEFKDRQRSEKKKSTPHSNDRSKRSFRHNKRPQFVQGSSTGNHTSNAHAPSGDRPRSFNRARGGRSGRSSNFSRSDRPREPARKPFSQLSDKEMAERRATGRCFRCNEPGHMSRNCPQGNNISGRGGKPPGLATHNMEFVEEQSEEPEVLESLPLGYIDFESDDEWIEMPSRPRKYLGDCYAMQAQKILADYQEYPGDNRYDLWPGKLRDLRFDVLKARRSRYLVVDHVTKFRVHIPRKLLRNPYFNLPGWYARRRERHLNLPRRARLICVMGYSLAEEILPLLNSGIKSHYPNVNDDTEPEGRFAMDPTDSTQTTWKITDYDLNHAVSVPREFFENPNLDVAGWYQQHLEDTGIYDSMYCARVFNEHAAQTPSPDLDLGAINLDTDGEVPPTSETNSSWSEVEDELPELASLSDAESMYQEDLAAEPDDDMPGLQDVSDTVSQISAREDFSDMTDVEDREPFDLDDFLDGEDPEAFTLGVMGPVYARRIAEVLQNCQPYPGDNWDYDVQSVTYPMENRFVVSFSDEMYAIVDRLRDMTSYIHEARVRYEVFSLGRWYATLCAQAYGARAPSDTAARWMRERDYNSTTMGRVLERRIEHMLQLCAPYPGDHPDMIDFMERFRADALVRDMQYIYVKDTARLTVAVLKRSDAENPDFHIGDWYDQQMLAMLQDQEHEEFHAQQEASALNLATIAYSEDTWTRVRPLINDLYTLRRVRANKEMPFMELCGIQTPREKYTALQRNAAAVKGKARSVPKPLVVTVKINGHPARALLDSGSLGDFMSTNLADQLKVKRTELSTPLTLQLAVQGSRSKVNVQTAVDFEYQQIKETRTFDIINVNSYDLIMGTPFMYEHQVCVGFNPARVVIGSVTAQPIRIGADARLMAHAVSFDDDAVRRAREHLVQYAEPLCKDMDQTPLPPLRVINHTIPLINENVQYPWRPSRCPEAFRAQWAEKRDAYLKTGRWKITSAGNTVPMLLIPKPKKGDKPPELRTVVDLRERNKNTHKMTSPLPDIDGMLRRTASKPFRSAMDMKAAYEQIRIEPDHVDRTTVTTPDGNMVSLVIQIGDCNAPATYQALMNHLFSAFIGRFMDIYLDDIVVYSDSLDEHVSHVKQVIDILAREKLYLSRDKLHFLEKELNLLGRIIDDQGIRMDPHKVDTVINWKVPTNRDLLRGFLGSVGYLADDVPGVRIPMGILSAITGDTVPFRWTYTEQRAFEDVKHLVQAARDHRRVPLKYGPDAPKIWMITDGCSTGIAGAIAQGPTLSEVDIAAFYSAKLNSAQQNYPVHEIEMLAGIETMLRHTDILQGTHFTWITDHKGLTHLLNQKNLSGRQARWLEKISSFDFKVEYIPGDQNILADALSRMYASDAPGTERARSEYTYHDIMDEDTADVMRSELPILAGLEAAAAVPRPRVRRQPPAAETGRPETSREFAARVKDRFVLRGPAERKEGENGTPSTSVPRMIIKIPARRQAAPEVDVPPESLVNNVPTIMDLASTTCENGLDLIQSIKDTYVEDPFFDVILKNPKEFRNYEVSDGLIYIKERENKLLCIPHVKINGRNAREIVIDEAHSTLAHLGASKTVDYLRSQVWWKTLVPDTKAFCETCITCKRSKPDNHKPYGLLNPLSVPSEPWESIGIDFVGPLPTSHNRNGSYDMITVIICLLTGMVHIVPSKQTDKAEHIAELMFEEVYKHHGIPKNIISDRDSLFTSIFWARLHELVGTKLKMSSAYHPQTDGSTERANRTITQMLRQCIGDKQTDWVAKLPAIEFAINSARSETTGYSPFFLNHGRMPRPMIWDAPPQTEYPAIRRFAQQKKLAIIAAHDSILAARVKQTRAANRKRLPSPFQVHDFVYVSTKNITFPKGLARKLVPKYIGPYKITRDFGNFSYRIDLPSRLKQRGVHDVFHASLLRIHHPNDDRLFPGRLDNQVDQSIDGENEWAVERILGHSGSGRSSYFKVLWKAGDITWVPYEKLEHLPHISQYLEVLEVSDVSKLPTGDNIPPLGDPQVFLGHISASDSIPTLSLYIIPYFRCLSLSPHSFISVAPPSPSQLFYSRCRSILPMSKIAPPGIPHPALTRIDTSTYLVRDPKQPTAAVDLVGTDTIRTYCRHAVAIDKHAKTKPFVALESPPDGYHQFALLFNQHARVGDPTFPVWDENEGRYHIANPRVTWPAFMCGKFHDSDAPATTTPNHSVYPQAHGAAVHSTPFTASPEVVGTLINETLISDINARAYQNRLFEASQSGRGSRGGRGFRGGSRFFTSFSHLGPHPYKSNKAKKVRANASGTNAAGTNGTAPVASTSGASANSTTTAVTAAPAPAPVPAVVSVQSMDPAPVIPTTLPTAASILASAANSPNAGSENDWTATSPSFTITPSALHTSTTDSVMDDADPASLSLANDYLGWNTDLLDE